MTTPTKPTKEATTPLPVLTEALTPERVRELRDEALKDAESYDANDMTTTAKEWRDYAALADHWLRTQAGWQPIETAPDGERVLVSYLFHGVRRDTQVDIKEIQSDNKGDRCIWPSRYYEATHWRHLPPPPQEPA